MGPFHWGSKKEKSAGSNGRNGGTPFAAMQEQRDTKKMGRPAAHQKGDHSFCKNITITDASNGSLGIVGKTDGG